MTDYLKLANEARGRADAATPGPWVPITALIGGSRKRRVAVEAFHIGKATQDGGYAVASCGWPTDPASIPDATFIAHAREDVPRLCSAVRTLHEQHNNALDEYGRVCKERDEACAAVRELHARTAWRPVTEDDPPQDEAVLVVWTNGLIEIRTRTMEYTSAGWTGGTWFGTHETPTHWMPLPTRPTEETR